MTLDLRKPSVRWTGIVIAWCIYGMMVTGQYYVGYARGGKPISFDNAMTMAMPFAFMWLLLTPAVLALARRYPLERLHRARNLVIHGIASILFAVVQNVSANLIVMMLHSSEKSAFSWDWIIRSLVYLFDYGILSYWVIVLIRQAIVNYHKIREKELNTSQLETQLAQARLQALRTQLQPHFLFNTLHSISELIHEDIEAADTMIARLGDFLRLTLENSGAPVVRLEHELDSLRCYFEIEKTRFQGGLTLDLQVDPDVLDAAVPSFLWQPLVENAIRHGFATSQYGGRIIVRARRCGEVLQLQVQDNGTGLVTGTPSETSVREGIGLANTRAILHHLYGDAHSLTICNAQGGGVVATMEMPFTPLDG